METSTASNDKHVEQLAKFAKDWARTRMPKYDGELLTIALRPSPDFRDKISEALWEKGVCSAKYPATTIAANLYSAAPNTKNGTWKI